MKNKDYKCMTCGKIYSENNLPTINFTDGCCSVGSLIEIDKTIRIWDKDCKSCADCHLCQYIEDDYADEHIKCGYTGESVFDSYELRKIDSTCPFLNPLTKQNIEICGWKLNMKETYYSKEFEGDGSDHQIYYQDNCFMTIYNWDSQIIFRGSVNNLPEFKLLLKQLNIE